MIRGKFVRCAASLDFIKGNSMSGKDFFSILFVCHGSMQTSVQTYASWGLPTLLSIILSM